MMKLKHQMRFNCSPRVIYYQMLLLKPMQGTLGTQKETKSSSEKVYFRLTKKKTSEQADTTLMAQLVVIIKELDKTRRATHKENTSEILEHISYDPPEI